jgi:hypothetical protein
LYRYTTCNTSTTPPTCITGYANVTAPAPVPGVFVISHRVEVATADWGKSLGALSAAYSTGALLTAARAALGGAVQVESS